MHNVETDLESMILLVVLQERSAAILVDRPIIKPKANLLQHISRSQTSSVLTRGSDHGKASKGFSPHKMPLLYLEPAH
jgi:hypothetical protein